MEIDITCNWLLYYSSQNQDIINSEIITDVQCNPSNKHQLCSYVAYYNCGKVLFEDYPLMSSGFVGLFDYLNKSEWKVMDKMQEDEQLAYIDKLKDYDDFSIKHHTSIIKCLMKSYVCYRAPLDRIKRALEALGVVTSLEDATYVSNYRQLHKHLTIWLKEAAKKGIQRISKFNKDISDSNMLTIVERSCLGSLILYTMMYYTQTKMINYKVTLPEVESLSNHLSAKPDISFTHSKIVISAFADICDNKDTLPLQIDGLLTKSMDNVPTSLTIALIFHWTFGNSLRNLENLLKSSSKLNDSDKIFNQRPTHLPLNDTPKDSRDYRAFFVNSNNSANCVRPIFNKDKEGHNRKLINGSLTSGKPGEISPDSFITPTEEEMPSFTNSVTPPIKLLSYKTTDNASKIKNNNISSDTVSLNLKSQFQTKLLQKQNLIKLKPNLNLTTTNETTTWLAQSNKNDIMPIPLTPKKKVKPESKILSDSQQNLTQSQLNEIQVQLSLRRKKIEEDKKGLVQQTEKNLESSKQKVFFQALNKNSLVVRHKSLELIKDNPSNDTCDGNRRLSMYISRTEKAGGGCTIKRLLSNQSLNKDMEGSNSKAENGKPFPKSIVKDVVKSQEKKASINIDSDQTNKEVLKKNNDHNESIVRLISKESSTIVLLPETSKSDVLDVVSLSRKNSSPSISSLSSLSNISGDKNLVTKDEYEKSIELLSTSLSSLQEELRILRLQQHSWNRQISEPSNTIDDRVDMSKVKSDNNSVVDTPTNTVIALKEVVELPKHVVQSCSSNDVDHYQIESTPTMKIIHNLSYESDKDSPDVAKLEPSQQVVHTSECAIHDKNNDLISQENKINSVESVNTDELKMSPECDRIDMTSSSESLTMSSVQPLTFVITDDQNKIDVLQKKAELLAKREQRRLTKLEMFRQRREQERENQISAANEELLEKEFKKRIEQEKRDILLQNYLDSKTEEKSPLSISERRSVSSTTTPVKSAKKSQTPRTNSKSTKQESVENLTLNPKRNTWFSSMRQPNRITSSSTSVLNSNVTADNGMKIGVPLPPQEYVGPKLFGKRKVKTNRSVIVNAISHCCLAGSVNVPLKESVLKELAEADGTHFMILFRDSRCQYRSLYLFDLVTEDLNLITGNGPKRITHEMVEKFFKYNSGGKQFNPILSTKHLSTAVDAICIQSIHWNTRPASQIISGAHSSLSLPRPKRF